jgi:hypothetical protein
MSGKKIHKFAAGVALATILGAACGTNDDDQQADAKKPSTASTVAAGKVAADPSSTGAASLRAGLTSQLQEHVYLAGIAVANGVGAGLDSAEFTAAAGALDDNSVALSESIASVYGKPAGDAFLPLWRKHIGFFVDYTKGKATNDQAMADKALADLDGYRTDFGAFIASANPNLPAEAVAEELIPHIQTLTAAIDGVIAKDPSTFTKLRAAAAHMPHTAEVLAGAIAKQFPDKFTG